MEYPLTTMTKNNVVLHQTSGFQTPQRPRHNGSDFAGQGAKVGDPVNALKGGRVETAKQDRTAGNFVRLDHGGGLHTRYLHMDRLSVRVGDWIEEGQQVGTFGNTGDSTGAHLHFEIITGAKKVGTGYSGIPQDPIPYLLGVNPLPTLYIDGKKSALASFVEGGRMYVALNMKIGYGWCWIRHMGNAFAYDIVWDNPTLTATLTKERK